MQRFLSLYLHVRGNVAWHRRRYKSTVPSSPSPTTAMPTTSNEHRSRHHHHKHHRHRSRSDHPSVVVRHATKKPHRHSQSQSQGRHHHHHRPRHHHHSSQQHRQRQEEEEDPPETEEEEEPAPPVAAVARAIAVVPVVHAASAVPAPPPQKASTTTPKTARGASSSSLAVARGTPSSSLAVARGTPSSSTAAAAAIIMSSAPMTITSSTPTLELQDLIVYVRFRILDSIGCPGSYRKFMLKRKEQGAPFAIAMANHVLAVQTALKALVTLEQDIKTSHTLKNLHLVWQHVVESNTPPSDLQQTIGTCLITGKPNMPCIIIKGKGRGAHNFTVCNKFSVFLYHLWVTYKMDVLIKIYTRQCLDELDPQGTRPLAEISNLLRERTHEIRNMARMLHATYCHVTRSAIAGLQAVV